MSTKKSPNQLKWLLIGGFLCYAFNVFSQDSLRQHFPSRMVFLELGGAAGLYSINYEHFFINTDPHKVGVRLGVSALEGNRVSGKNTLFYGLPLMINYFNTRWKHQFELAFGPTFQLGYFVDEGVDTVTSDSFSFGTNTFYSFFIGYRFQNPEKKLAFKIGLTPLTADFITFSPWLGVSIGYVLKRE